MILNYMTGHMVLNVPESFMEGTHYYIYFLYQNPSLSFSNAWDEPDLNVLVLTSGLPWNEVLKKLSINIDFLCGKEEKVSLAKILNQDW